MPITHTVEEGDCVSSLASDFGLLRETIWNHPQNQALKNLRKDPNILLPGDLVFIPDVSPKELSVPSDEAHVFKTKCQREILRIVIEDEEGNPRAGAKYSLEFGNVVKKGTLGSDGLMSITISAKAKEASLTVGDAKDEHGIQEYRLFLGHLDPISDLRGVQQRLNNLGFDCGPVDGMMGPLTQAALARFQDYMNIEPTGELDDQTRSALQADHKS